MPTLHSPTMANTLPWNGRPWPTKSSAAAARRVSACFQCHKCSTGCPIGPDMDLLPSQIMRLVHLGAEADVLRVAGHLAVRLVRGLHHALPAWASTSPP